MKSTLFLYLTTAFTTAILGLALAAPLLFRILGSFIRARSHSRRSLLLTRVAAEKSKEQHQASPSNSNGDEEWERISASVPSLNNGAAPPKNVDWDGIVGFFHPFCNAGGGGERVLWAAIRAIQERWPEAVCVVYTGDQDVDKSTILDRVSERFGITLYRPSVHFMYLTKRDYVLASTWPRFTLLGQSLGSVRLAWEAFNLLVPDVFMDTMGYAFAVGLCSFLFPDVPNGAYVHYPTISTDMLDNLGADGQGVNAGTGEGARGTVKKYYWHAFARLYGWIGGYIDVVMANSSWTRNHIKTLWGPWRRNSALSKKTARVQPIEVVYPPCAVENLTSAIHLTSESNRKPHILYIAQFRPEKNHQLILESFAKLLSSLPNDDSGSESSPKLHLVGSTRNASDRTHIYSLRILAKELQISDNVTFILDTPWDTIVSELKTASIGTNAMWNEHFGIGVVEYQAAGLIPVVNASGGPMLDIVVDIEDETSGKMSPTGYHASTADEYANAFRRALELDDREKMAMRKRARKSAMRFSEEAFREGWTRNMEVLVDMQVGRNGKN
jgi:alpha-1,2-mannosyltransferase